MWNNACVAFPTRIGDDSTKPEKPLTGFALLARAGAVGRWQGKMLISQLVLFLGLRAFFNTIYSSDYEEIQGIPSNPVHVAWAPKRPPKSPRREDVSKRREVLHDSNSSICTCLCGGPE